MSQEIERKYLVRGDDFKAGITPVFIKQGFISTAKENVVRVRIYGEKGFLAIKGSGSGIIRTEFEYEIPVPDARDMLETFCGGTSIEKFRYAVEYEGHTWEIDVFMKENSGLVLAEIELESENEKFATPPWIGKEVTGDPHYYNVNLIKNPFSNWI